MPYPLNEFFETQESEKQGGYLMIGDDYYASFTQLSLDEHIKLIVNFLKTTYLEGNNNTESADESNEEERETFFLKSYECFYSALSQGHSPMSCEDDIRQELCPAFQSKGLQKCFSRSMIWALCADILFRNGYKENAWSTLINYKKSECFTELAIDEEYKLAISNARRKAGEDSYGNRKPLQKNFIKLLSSEAPATGWPSHKVAAYKLAPIVLDMYMNSENASAEHFTEEGVETILRGWLRNNETCKGVFNENFKKTPS
tara:strand:+ start:1893 stop:2669 length:777 start_codon:yes stop_codon:yes gene_type:complete